MQAFSAKANRLAIPLCDVVNKFDRFEGLINLISFEILIKIGDRIILWKKI